MFEHQTLLPTRNLENVAADCNSILHVKEPTRVSNLSIIASNNFAFGGVNTCVVLERIS